VIHHHGESLTWLSMPLERAAAPLQERINSPLEPHEVRLRGLAAAWEPASAAFP
jgi:hypothetical protein